MKVLIACEFSGIVRTAFANAGHDAWSCDFLPTESKLKSRHFQGDVREILKVGAGYGTWDLLIAHPPCQYLCSSGLHWNKRVEGRQQKTEEALDFVKFLLDAPVRKIALENPVGCISTRIRKYDQKIQPWQYGHDASKGTCLWLKNLPKLKATNIIPPKGYSIEPTQDDATYKTIDGVEFATMDENPLKPVWGNQTPSGQNKLGPSEDRWKLRSMTYPGIAEAMATQWGVGD